MHSLTTLSVPATCFALSVSRTEAAQQAAVRQINTSIKSVMQ